MLFRYKVTYVEDNGSFDLETEYGIVSGNSYCEAVGALEDSFAAVEVLDISLYECENPLCDEELEEFVRKK